MKFVTYSLINSKDKSIGVILENNIYDIYLASKKSLPNNMISFIERGDSALNIVKDLIQLPDTKFLSPIEECTLYAPILNPPSLKDAFAFEDHARAGSERIGISLSEYWYELPVYYKGNHREILGPNDVIPWPFYTRKLDFECEIACVISKRGKNLSIEEAKNYIFGYMIFNDVSARDIQKKEMALRLGPAKSKDFANVFGPYLVTKDEIDLNTCNLSIKVNNEEWSTGSFKDQYWNFPTLISHISQEENIYPGDIIGSGTFYKGCGLDLNRWIQPGDTLELTISSLGTLTNTIGKPNEQRELIYNKK